MPRYRNDGSHALNYQDSGGPEVAPGEEFEHEIPPAQLASHLRMGVISEVGGDVHVHDSRELFDRLQVSGRRHSLIIGPNTTSPEARAKTEAAVLEALTEPLDEA